MVLSNAERQKRFRERLKARAAGAELGEQAQRAMDEAFAALWTIFSRPSPEGAAWGDIEEFSGAQAFQAAYRGKPRETLEALSSFLDPAEETVISDAERAALERGVAVCRAASMLHLPEPEAAKRPTRRKR